MSQSTNKPRVAQNEARSYSKYLRSSPRKLNLIAAMIRGKKADRALIDLEFLQKRVADDVRKVLQAAVANAENNHNLDVDRLVVKEATVGRTLVMRRFHARGRGRASRVEKPFANLTIVVGEAEAEAKQTKKEAPAKKTAAPKATTKKAPAKKAAAAA